MTNDKPAQPPAHSDKPHESGVKRDALDSYERATHPKDIAAAESHRTFKSSGSWQPEQEMSIEIDMGNGKVASRRNADVRDKKDAIKNTGVHSLSDVGQKLSGVAEGFSEFVNESLDKASKDPEMTNKSIQHGAESAIKGAGYLLDKVVHGDWKALQADANKIGKNIVDTSNAYSAMSQHDQGKFIGKNFVPAFVPDLPGPAKEAGALGKGEHVAKAAGAIQKTEHVATKVEHIAEKAEHAAGKVESKTLAGAKKLDRWERIDEVIAKDVVAQSHEDSCVSACGEMLSEGRLTEKHLMAKLGYPCDALELAKQLGEGWAGNTFGLHLPKGLLDRTPFMVSLKEPHWSPHNANKAHAVIVDGLNAAGELMIRDPAKPSRYSMSISDFEPSWTGAAVYREVIKK